MKVQINRDSVSLGDDIDPHEWSVDLPGAGTVKDLIQEVLRSGYLPKIADGEATWTLRAGRRPIALLAQQWRHVSLLVDDEATVERILETFEADQLHFQYEAQSDPDEMLKGFAKRFNLRLPRDR